MLCVIIQKRYCTNVTSDVTEKNCNTNIPCQMNQFYQIFHWWFLFLFLLFCIRNPILCSTTISIVKTQISYLVRTTRFWNNLHQVRSTSKDQKAKSFILLGALKLKLKGLNRKVAYTSRRKISVLLIITLFRNC